MNVAIIDDHLLLSQALKSILEKSFSDIEIHLFSTGRSFLSTDFSNWQPDIAILDMLMPEMDGMEVLEKGINMLQEKCSFLIVTSLTDAYSINKALQKGAKGYVAKGAPIQELIVAIQTIKSGRQYISQELKDDLLNFMFSDNPAIAELSPRESEVLQRICSGNTPKEIAYDMKLSIHTIQLYIKNILRKFGLNRTSDLIVFAIKRGLYKL